MAGNGTNEDPPAPAAARRRLEGKPGEPVGKGCLLWGAALGIIVGLTFAFYGLGPILRHFYGETRVRLGDTYEGSNFTIVILDATTSDISDPGLVRVRLAVSGERAWTPQDFKIQYPDAAEWVEATSAKALPGPGGSALSILLLTFKAPNETPAEALHLTSPRVKFNLR